MRLSVAAAKTVDALWALQLDDGEDTAAAAYLTSAAEGEQTTSTFLDQDGKNHPLFRAEDDDTWRPDRYAREALAYSESHDDLLGRTLREKTTRSVWQGVRDKTSETGRALGEQIISTGRALGEQIISDPWGTVKAVGGAIKDDTWEMVRHPIRTAGNIGEGVWTQGKDAAYNLGNSAKSTWAGSFGTENALNTLYGRNMGAPLLGMSAIQASLTAAQVVPAAKGAQALGKGAQALGKGALRAGKTVGEKGLFQLGRGEGVANAGVSGKVADGVVERRVTKSVTVSKSRFPESAKHIEDAVSAGKPNTLTINRSGAAANRRDSLRGVETKPGLDRDEFPPAMFQEGGKGASVRHINSSDNRGAGACIGAQCRGLSDGTRVKIDVVD